MFDAAHYDAEYQQGRYSKIYAGRALPEYALWMNQWSVDYVIALLGLRPEAGPILDLGSGVGNYLNAWESRGFTTVGREISNIAIASSGRSNVHLGDATDLSGYAQDEFQLVFSNAFLEHVPDDRVLYLLKDELRVARGAAHYIAHEVGNDPGHINVKSPREWELFFKDRVPVACTVSNPLVFMSPVFLHLRELPPHVDHASRHFMDIDENGCTREAKSVGGPKEKFRWR